MKKIIPIDDNSRIVIDGGNFTLQFRRKSKRKISWRNAGYFTNLKDLSSSYLHTAPQRADNAIRSIEKLAETIKKAEENFARLFDNKF
jgi:hypothetical protein